MKTKMIYIIFLLQAFIFTLSNVITPQFLMGLHLEKYYFGYFSAIWSFGMLISSPIWGKLATQYGKKKFVILGIIIYGTSQLGFYLFDNIILLAILRLTSGIGVGAIVTLLLSYLILHTAPEQRANALSKRMAFLTIGVTISYTLSGYIGLVLTKELFLIQSLLSIIFALMVMIFIDKDKVQACIYPKQFNMFNSLKFLKSMDKSLIIFLFSITLTTMTFTNLEKFIDLYIIDKGYEVSVVGNVQMVFGIVLIITNLIFVPKLKKYLGNIYVLQTITVMMSIIIMITFMDNEILVSLYSIFLGYIVLKGIYVTSEQLYLSKAIEPEKMNIFVGIRQSFTCLGMILGPIIGGHIYAYNPMNLFQFNILCLLISSVMISYIKLSPRVQTEIQYSK